MFENEGDKKKKCIPLARYTGQEGYTLIIYSYESKRLLTIFVILLDIRICVDFVLRNSRDCFVIVTIE